VDVGVGTAPTSQSPTPPSVGREPKPPTPTPPPSVPPPTTTPPPTQPPAQPTTPPTTPPSGSTTSPGSTGSSGGSSEPPPPPAPELLDRRRAHPRECARDGELVLGTPGAHDGSRLWRNGPLPGRRDPADARPTRRWIARRRFGRRGRGLPLIRRLHR